MVAEYRWSILYTQVRSLRLSVFLPVIGYTNI
jgi:hypothetical protein